MKHVITAILLVVGAVNIYPLIGVLSVERLASLYGVTIEDADLVLLMRHRAVLFGLLGAFIMLSAFRPAARVAACAAGLVSMVAFVLLAFATPGHGAAMHKIVVADIVASVGLVVVLVFDRRGQT